MQFLIVNSKDFSRRQELRRDTDYLLFFTASQGQVLDQNMAPKHRRNRRDLSKVSAAQFPSCFILTGSRILQLFKTVLLFFRFRYTGVTLGYKINEQKSHTFLSLCSLLREHSIDGTGWAPTRTLKVIPFGAAKNNTSACRARIVLK